MVCRPQDQYYHQQEETRVTVHNFKRYPPTNRSVKKIVGKHQETVFLFKTGFGDNYSVVVIHHLMGLVVILYEDLPN